ncbi:hypothetical protein GCM10027417_26880 [Glutamicibacter endophyticus]
MVDGQGSRTEKGKEKSQPDHYNMSIQNFERFCSLTGIDIDELMINSAVVIDGQPHSLAIRLEVLADMKFF